MKKLILMLVMLMLWQGASAQFHTLKMPQPSNHVIETQRLGVTDITIDYSSPRVRGRDVWNEEIPQNGDPIAWRAGANMNTTISFSTDVMIEGKPLEAGTYGIHIVPRSDRYTVMFAHNSHLWGSYYLDIEKDITLKVDVQDTITSFSEKLDYEFIYKSEDAVVIGLEWAQKRIPFTVSVDLEKTVLTSFRSELRGINTNRWESWHDAANWCLQRNINLDEALTWVNRSIEGGYGGFAANRNLTNLSTKAMILQRLNRNNEMVQTLEEAESLTTNADEISRVIVATIRAGNYEQGAAMSKRAIKKYPDTWFLEYYSAVSLYGLDNKKQAVKHIEKAHKLAPDDQKEYISSLVAQMKEGTFQLPTRR